MLIGKLFLPLAAPGFAALGLGMMGVVNGAYNAAEVIAIVLGLLVVAIAGVFTIRSNVAKIWREQAEGEKARNADLVETLAAAKIEAAEQLATATQHYAAGIAAIQHDMNAQREAAATIETQLTAARARTDLTPVLALLHEILGLLTANQKIEVAGEHGGPLIVEGS